MYHKSVQTLAWTTGAVRQWTRSYRDEQTHHAHERIITQAYSLCRFIFEVAEVRLTHMFRREWGTRSAPTQPC